MIRGSIALLLLAAVANAIPIDNGVEGDPEIECGPTSITVNFNTQKAFEGHVYVKGLFDQAGCRNDEGGRQVAGISLPFDSCNVARTRSLNPKGVFVSTVVIISFHPKFETKVDRAYRIQCFYMEADKTVSQELEVSMLTTGFQTQIVPMPVCRYEILAGGPTGAPVHFALVGDSVYHKWTCDTETVDTFCMVVHSCFVDDGNGDKVDLLTAEGCAVDKFLLNNLEYPTDLMAGQEAHVFKYADRTQLFFQCQITITIKEPNAQCVRPECPAPEGFGPAVQAAASGAGAAPAASTDNKAASAPAASSAAAPAPAPAASPAPAAPAAGAEAAAPAPAGGRRRNRQRQVIRLRREAPAWEMDNAGIMDVRADMSTLDVDDQVSALPSDYSRRAAPIELARPSEGICMSTGGFMTFIALAVALLASVVVVASCLVLRPANSKA